MCLTLKTNKKIISRETFWDLVKLARDSAFTDALGPRDAVKTKAKSNTEYVCQKSKLSYKHENALKSMKFLKLWNYFLSLTV